jgi:hypothetical protein
VFPKSLVDKDIRILVGFGIHSVQNEVRRSGGRNFSVVVSGGIAARQAIVELERTFVGEVAKDVSARDVYVFHEARNRITRVEQSIIPTKIQRRACKAIAPPLVVSVRLFEQADRSPMCLLSNERTGDLILAIGNIGERIEWHPEGYRPCWFDDLLVTPSTF